MLSTNLLIDENNLYRDDLIAFVRHKSDDKRAK